MLKIILLYYFNMSGTKINVNIIVAHCNSGGIGNNNSIPWKIRKDLTYFKGLTSEVMKDNLLKHDAKEGINAFIEKRSPTWKDK